MGRLGWVISLSWSLTGLVNRQHVLGNGPHVLGNGQHMLGNGPPVLGNGPHLCTQFMNFVILIMGRLGWVVGLSWPLLG